MCTRTAAIQKRILDLEYWLHYRRRIMREDGVVERRTHTISSELPTGLLHGRSRYLGAIGSGLTRSVMAFSSTHIRIPED